MLASQKGVCPNHDHLLDSPPFVICAHSTLLNLIPTPWYDDNVILTSVSNIGYGKRR